ncbi:hypothetical protein BKA70DRAFT_831019 [Coprinopsis sp. MPI-PUGE-AT-0042]|nr:hypothetical protein BKA70DRAFT_831019 [Coprinopsis sp. MPI-PUGE-AT-0042]
MDIESYSDTLYTHRSLEMLIIDRESLLASLHCFAFPCLRLLAIRGRGLKARSFDYDSFRSDILVRLLARSPSEPPLLVSLRGCFLRSLLHRIITTLPPSSHLHLDVSGIMRGKYINYERDFETDCEDEDLGRDYATIPIQWHHLEAIYCGRHTIGLWWIPISNPERINSSHSLKIYLPKGYRKLTAASDRQAELREYDLELRALPEDALKAKLYWLAPQFSRYGQTWWRF